MKPLIIIATILTLAIASYKWQRHTTPQHDGSYDTGYDNYSYEGDAKYGSVDNGWGKVEQEKK